MNCSHTIRKSVVDFLMFQEVTSKKYPFRVPVNSITSEQLDAIVKLCNGNCDTEIIYNAAESVIGFVMYPDTGKVCPLCHGPVFKSDNREYSYQCFQCDEDFYRFEVKESYI